MLLPVMTMNLPMNIQGSIHNQNIQVAQNVVVPQTNIETSGSNESTPNQVMDPEVELLQAKAKAIDAYYKAHGMPLEGTGMEMAQEAEKNGLDWRLLAAITVRESTGGKHDCTSVDHNAFGWASCKVGFKSDEQAIVTVAKNLGGNNPSTAKHYDGKTTLQILHAYNPPSIVPHYAEQVISIMNDIGDADMAITPSSTPITLKESSNNT